MVGSRVSNGRLITRFMRPRLMEALNDTPVVLVHGPLQRDVRELARISTLDAVPRLLQLAAGQTARLLNSSELAAPFQLSRPTIRDYVTLLERIFLIEMLQPWRSNCGSRQADTTMPSASIIFAIRMDVR